MRKFPSLSVVAFREVPGELIGRTKTLAPGSGCPPSFTTRPTIVPVVISFELAGAGVCCCARTETHAMTRRIAHVANEEDSCFKIIFSDLNSRQGFGGGAISTV